MNIFNGPMVFNIDFSLLKNISLGERARVQIRAEAFNLLNNVNLYMSQFQDINSTSFGRATGTSTAARVVQFGARLEF